MIRRITGWAILSVGILVFAICTALLDLAWDQDLNWDPGIHAPGLLWGSAAGIVISGIGMCFMPWNRTCRPTAREMAARRQQREWEDANPPGLAQFCAYLGYLAGFALAAWAMKYVMDGRPLLAAVQFLMGAAVMVGCGTLHDRVQPDEQPDPVIVQLHRRTRETERRLSAYVKQNPRGAGYFIGAATGVLAGALVLVIVPAIAWKIFPGEESFGLALAGITGLALAFVRLKGNKK